MNDSKQDAHDELVLLGASSAHADSQLDTAQDTGDETPVFDRAGIRTIATVACRANRFTVYTA